jgi:3-methylcrotonyl-CoA carboxylase alpha subunit
MIRRLLVANRGEIVCRIARSARRLGVTTIAVYSDADRNAQHARAADEAYYLGPAAAAESYLNIDKLIALARSVSADAVHPGYGFLSENARFAQACQDAGLIFVGPPPSAISAMGSKSASKAAMAAAGVPVAPGYHGAEQSAQRLIEEAARIGYPLIIKASAGGGGKGMQVVHSGAEVPAAVESAQRLARTAFGDDRLLMERYFPQARHVEVQVFADSHGQTVSLFDRDCSVQRRHQKIIEEAPAPDLRDEVRASMAAAAVKTAQAVGYIGAGTVEFLVDEAQNFYFMEMNTRLQVEHPVTEFITGIDLVEWQLRIAQGEPLPCGQGAITQRGCAVEARLYAEDPAKGYLPSVGQITHLRWPGSAPGLRLDTGYERGDEVSSYYDPMLGKIIAWGESRAVAIDLLRHALSEVEIVGVATNRAQLVSVLGDEQFRRAAVATNFLESRRAELVFGEPQAGNTDIALAAVWCAAQNGAENALWEDTRGWRLTAPANTAWRFAQGSALVELSAPDTYVARVGGDQHTIRVLSCGPEMLHAECDGRVLTVNVFTDPALHLFLDGRHVMLNLERTDDALQSGEAGEEGSLLTPLPGTVVAVHVAAGQQVARGAPLITVEAMKMEHTLTAPYDGVVARLAYGVKDRVQAGAVLVELTPLEK